MHRNVIGIDPGATGAIAVIHPGRSQVRLIPLKGMTRRDIKETIMGESLEPAVAFLEKVGSMPRNSGKSMFSFGKNVGWIEMALDAANIPFIEVPPQTWQRSVSLGRRVKGGQADRKRAHLAKAQQLYPQVRMTQVTADAVLIAEHGYQEAVKLGYIAP